MASRSDDREHCRACMSVEELMERARKLAGKVKKTKESSIVTASSAVETNKLVNMRADCPLNTEELGRSTWNLLHTVAAYYPEQPTEEQKKNAKAMMQILGKTYPCGHCAEDLRKDLAQHPPNVESRDKFSLWMCEMHNRVNRKLGKREYNCSLWKERWLDGWKDGSCDY